MRKQLSFAICAMAALVGCSTEEQLPNPEKGYELRIMTFEDDDTRFAPYNLDYANKQISCWSDLVDNKQYDGELLYGDYEEHLYHWCDEGNTYLTHSFLTPYWGGGGHAISNYIVSDYATIPSGVQNWYELQLATPMGGHNGSRNFAVHNGYLDSFNDGIYNASLATLAFSDGVERVVDHMWVTNTSYLLNSLTYGNDFCPQAGKSSMLNIVVEGFDLNDEKVGEARLALCHDGELLTQWTRFDLYELGAVAKITFNIEASDDLIGEYGLMCPAYFAYDDVAVRFEK